MSESNSQSVIYAIEEPETSQHPTHHLQLLRSFQHLSSQDKTQIIVTTHVPGLAQAVEGDQIRYIYEEEGKGKIIGRGDVVLKDVANALGVLPDPNKDRKSTRLNSSHV